MIHNLLQILKKIIGPRITRLVRPMGHGIKTFVAAAYFGFPARKLYKIGITGTKGKTTTTVLMGRLANLSGIKTGYFSTAIINIEPQFDSFFGDKDKDNTDFAPYGEYENPYKMSSLDGWLLQKNLRKMVDAGCTHSVIELSSEGLVQNRHWGLGGLDVGVLLNIFPEHLEAHGSFENYVAAKRLLIQSINANGLFVAQTTTDHWRELWKGTKHQKNNGQLLTVTPQEDYFYTAQQDGINLQYKSENLQMNSIADFDLENAMLAYITLNTIGAATTLENIKLVQGVSGRMQTAVESEHIKIIVDYAHEAESMRRLLTFLKSQKDLGLFTHIIHVVSCDGVGRDDWKKPLLGAISSEYADITIATTDNYSSEDNPQDIIGLLTQNIHDTSHLLTDIDRKNAFMIALEQASNIISQSKNHTKVVIVSTGVGNENGITQPGGKMDWNEKLIWQDTFDEFSKHYKHF